MAIFNSYVSLPEGNFGQTFIVPDFVQVHHLLADEILEPQSWRFTASQHLFVGRSAPVVAPTVRVPYKVVAPADPAVPTVKVFLSSTQDGFRGLRKNRMVTCKVVLQFVS